MHVNVVMVMKDRPELTWQALSSLYDHTNKEMFSLVLVDDGSEEMATKARVKQALYLFRDYRFTLVTLSPNRGIVGLVKNIGVDVSERVFGRGEWLYVSDNDVKFTEEWLGKLTLAATAAEDNYALIGGSNHPYHQSTGKFIVKVNNSMEVHDYHAIAGYSHLMKWETWDEFGPYDANAKGLGQSEDTAFCARMRKRGSWCTGAVWPEVVLACGLTDTEGKAAVGSDVMRRYKGVVQQ